jgi:hypothetical protein
LRRPSLDPASWVVSLLRARREGLTRLVLVAAVPGIVPNVCVRLIAPLFFVRLSAPVVVAPLGGPVVAPVGALLYGAVAAGWFHVVMAR